MLHKVIIAIIFCLITNTANATTYYVDFDTGSDTAAGTSTGTAWKTLPGTRNVGDTAYITTSYGGGVISTTNKVPCGTVLVLKLGTTHDISDGNRIDLRTGAGEFYNDCTSASYTTFTTDSSWGTGQVILDGTSFTTAYPIVYIRVNGVKWDGISNYTIKIQDSPRQGILAYDGSGAPVNDIAVEHLEFYNNGTECTSGSECLGPAQLQIRYSNNFSVDNVLIEGNSNHITGFTTGETNQYGIGTISNSISRNHAGNDPPNDTGMGFSAENSQLTFTNCLSYSNLKGWDLGQGGSTDYTINYKVINSSAYNNGYSGISMNNKGSNFDETTYPVKYYIINSVIRDNGKYGIEHYCGPYETHIVHNIVDNNGGGWTNQCGGNLRIGPCANNTDNQTIKGYVYNNAMYKPLDNSNICEFHHDSDGQAPAGGTDFSLYSNYNSWRQSGTEDQFAMFAFSKDGGLGDDSSTYTYSSVGNTSENWYLKYSNTIEPEPPLFGIGHYHADANSVTTEPPFTDVVNHNYTLTSLYPGTNISSQPWYISEMGTDRNGTTRSTWDIGAYEYMSGICTNCKNSNRTKSDGFGGGFQ